LVFLEINIGIAGISFVMWIVVHSAYSDKINDLRAKAISKLDTQALNLMRELGQQWTPDSRKKMGELLAKYSEADQPRGWLRQGTNIFLYSAMIAALGIVCNLGRGVPGFETFGLLEGPFAFFAVVFMIWAAYHTYQVVAFLSAPEEDPELPSLPMIVAVAIVQFAAFVFLYIAYPGINSPLIWVRAFIGTLVLSLIMGFVLIVRWEADPSLAEKVLEILLFASPWIFFGIVIVFFSLNLPLP